MRVLILEDNDAQREMLSNIVADKFNPSVITLCKYIDEMREEVNSNNYDVLLLDVEMHGKSSIDEMKDISRIHPGICSKTIFITAHQKYAMDAINKTHCFGYLLKPYDEKKIAEAITKLVGTSKRDKGKVEFFDFKIKGDVHFVNKDHIMFFEIQSKKPILHTQNDVFSLPRTTVSNLMGKLNNDNKQRFVRCRRDNIVNLNQIAHIKRQGTLNYVVLNNGVKVPIGEKYKCELFNRLRI